MTVAQVHQFVEVSIRVRHQWERIVLLGGEPTLHPDLFAIIDELEILHVHDPKIEFRMYTNGYGARVQHILTLIPEWIRIHDTKKTKAPPLFSAYNVAPCDDPNYNNADFSAGCAVTEWCGLGITRHGIYPCGAGAAIARVYGLDIAIPSIADVNEQILKDQLSKLCRYCGHFRDYECRVRYEKTHDPADLRSWLREQVTSPTWQAAYESWSKARVALPLYQEPSLVENALPNN